MPFDFTLRNSKAISWQVHNSFISGAPVPAIMGVLNVTPDSFFDGGAYFNTESAIKHAEKLLNEGACIIDIGGESSRAGAKAVSAEEEIARLLPVIEQLKKLSIQREFFISVDTTKPEVALKALKAGAHIINDVSMLSQDSMARIIKEQDASVILNHRRGNFSSMQEDFTPYKNVAEEVKRELLNATQKLLSLGLKKEKICLDPGIGFGKTPKDNIDLIANAENFLQEGFPLLYGMSRKSYIGKIRGLESSDRLIPTLVSGVIAALGGVTVLRVHDVKETKESLALLEAFRNDGALYPI